MHIIYTSQAGNCFQFEAQHFLRLYCVHFRFHIKHAMLFPGYLDFDLFFSVSLVILANFRPYRGRAPRAPPSPWICPCYNSLCTSQTSLPVLQAEFRQFYYLFQWFTPQSYLLLCLHYTSLVKISHVWYIWYVWSHNCNIQIADVIMFLSLKL